MKKVFCRMAGLCLMMALMVFTLSGCFSNMLAPKVSAVAGTVYWDAVEGAANYEVYQNDNLKAVVTKTFFVANENIMLSKFHVIAKNADGSKASPASEKVVIYKQTGFAAEESLELALTAGEHLIPATVNYVHITGKAQGAYILVANRDVDLCIELDNVELTSLEGKSCISTSDGIFDASVNKYAVNIKVTGTNTLKGGDFITQNPILADNSEDKGADGGEGGSGIVLPLVAITGDGTLTLRGGKGGDGGKGADSAGLSFMVFGAGGNAGDGGCAIKTTTTVVSMATGGMVKANGGDAGAKGSPGDNGSAFSGPLNVGLWQRSFGKEGKKGGSHTGEVKQLSGTFMGDKVEPAK